MSVEEQLRELALLRRQIKEALAVFDARKEALEESEEYKHMEHAKQAVDSLMGDEHELMSCVRANVDLISAVNDYKNRNPYEGVTIKKFTALSITDEKKAKEWASENAPATLRLDERALQKVISGGVEVNWGSIVDDYRVQIATDLSKYIE